MNQISFIKKIWNKLIRKIHSVHENWHIKSILRKKTSLITSDKKIIYALTPPSSLANIGDQAQVIAIRIWLSKHFPKIQILEIDKNEVILGQCHLKKIINPNDIIFLHSGGNLGDRGMWSETGRRLMIQNFPNNRVISLPQTIYFSDTENGRKQKEISKNIYNKHKRLTIIGRDKESGNIAVELFPNAQVLTVPDFVLSLNLNDFGLTERTPRTGSVLACLRRDNESMFTGKERAELANKIEGEVKITDTTLSTPINEDSRMKVLKEFLHEVLEHEVMVTDRFHGLIFAVVCKRPAIVLPTVDHKLTSAVEWFDGINFVKLTHNTNDINNAIDDLLKDDRRINSDFKLTYFDTLPEKLGF